jgi:hypothetical protein
VVHTKIAGDTTEAVVMAEFVKAGFAGLPATTANM